MAFKKNRLMILTILIPQLAGIAGSFFTISNIPTWYAQLNKPVFAPPNWIFAPVWTLLYFLMGISLYLNLISPKKQSVANVRLFFVHLFFNFIWSPVFFGARSLFWGLVVILIIWAMIVAMIIRFSKVNPASSFLLYPYLIWVSFATILNFSLLLIN